MAGLIVTCLFAGFVIFPGWVCMSIWNILVSYTFTIPAIGLLQGTLLWGILVATYFAFRREKVVVCMKSPQGLSDEELKAVFADMKKQAELDPILQAMMKAREAELRVQTLENLKDNEIEAKTDVVEASTTESTPTTPIQ